MKTSIYCGFDWASETHYFVIKNARGQQLTQGSVTNSPAGFDTFIEALDQYRQGGSVALIVEANRGLPMNALIDVQWIDLFPVNPLKTRRLNEVEGHVRQKSDPQDASILCDYLIRKHKDWKHHYVERHSTYRQMKEFIGQETDLIHHIGQITQRLICHINTFMPDLNRIIPDIGKKVYLKYLMEFDPLKPAPAEQIRTFLRANRVRNQETIETFIQGHLQLRPLGKDKQYWSAQRDVLQAWARTLWGLRESLEQCQKKIQELFATLPEAPIYLSMPGLGTTLAPRMACLFGSKPSERFLHKAQAQAFFGQSPVTAQSGNLRIVSKRLNCHRFARHTCYLWVMALNRIPSCHWQRAFLKKHQQRGDKMPTRYRKLGTKMVAILYQCLVTNQLYQESIYRRNLQNAA